MARQVEELLLAAQREGGHVALQPSLSDVSATLRRCADAFAPIAAERDVTLTVETPDRLAALVDADKLASAVTNLLANALRHTPDGGHVRCSLRARIGTLVVEVADSGPGVPPADREAIFAPYRTDGRGTGLGLAIVREIATLHGGDVTVLDAPEGGALFRLVLPMRRAGEGVASPPAPLRITP